MDSRIAAGIAGVVLSLAPLICGPAAADPAAPTLEPIEPPPPPPQPAPAAAPNPAPVPSHASDEAAIRQVIQASVGAFNAQNWGAHQNLYCAAKQATYSVADMQGAYNDSAPIQVAVTAVNTAGDVAFAPILLTDRNGGPASMVWRLVRENGWKICSR